MTLQDVGVLVGFTLALLGWAYQLGRSDARLSRSEKDITEMKMAHERDMASIEVSRSDSAKETRKEISDGFSKVYDKLDNLPCHQPKWRSGDC